MIKNVLAYSLLGMFALCDIAFAALYQYADESGAIHITNDPGSLSKNQRGRVKIVEEDDDHGTSPMAGVPTKAHEPGKKSRSDQGTLSIAPAPAHAPVSPPSQSLAVTQPEPQHEQPATAGTDTLPAPSAVDSFFARRFRSLMEDKFKDAKTPAQIAAMNADTSSDCTKYKKSMDEDLTNVHELMKDVNRRRAQGDSEFLIKMQVIWGLRHFVSMIYDGVFTPKHCQDEFGRENKDRMDDLNKELAGASKNGPEH